MFKTLSKVIFIVLVSLVGFFCHEPLMAHAQVFSQNQVVIQPYGGWVNATSTSGGAKLNASSTPFFSSFYANTGHITTLTVGSCSGCGSGSSSFGTSSLSAALPLVYTQNASMAQFSINQSGPTSDGYLSSTDWNSFNARLSTSSLGLIDKGYFFSTTSANFWQTTKWFNNYPFPNSATSSVVAFSGGLVSGASTTLSYLAGNAAGSFIAVDPTGKIIATSTSSGGVTAVTATYPVQSSGGATPNITLAFGTTTQNFWSLFNSFTSLFATNASATNATTTNLALVGSAANCNGSNALTTDSSGVVRCSAQPQGTVTSVSGTANQISSTGGATPVLALTSHVIFGAGGYESALGTTTAATSSTFAITGISAKILKTLASGAVAAATGDADYQNPITLTTTGSGVATFIADTLNIPNNPSFSTTSAAYFSSLGLAFSTTSNDYWKTQRDFFSTSSAAYFSSLGLAFSTTSSNYWSGAGLGFSTTSANFWQTTKWFNNYPFPLNATTSSLTFGGATSTGTLYVAASTTLGTTLSGAGLTSCNSATNALTWSGGTFGCNTITGGTGSAYPFTPASNFGVTNQATTGILWLQNGLNASSTSHMATTTLIALDQGGQVYNVKAYGALGDGVTDDTAAIVATLAKGGTTFFPAGTYLVTGLTLAGGAHMLGVGAGLYGTVAPVTQRSIIKLKNASNGNLINIPAGNSYGSIEHMEFDGNKANQSGSGAGNGINIADAVSAQEAQWRLVDVEVYNASTTGIYIGNYRQAMYTEQTRVTASGNYGMYIAGSDGTYIKPLAATSGLDNIFIAVLANVTRIVGGDVWSATGNGINISSTNNVTIEGTGIDHNGKNGITINGTGNVSLVGNIFHSNSQSANNTYSDVSVDSQISDFNTTIESNTFGPLDGGITNKRKYAVDTHGNNVLSGGNVDTATADGTGFTDSNSAMGYTSTVPQLNLKTLSSTVAAQITFLTPLSTVSFTSNDAASGYGFFDNTNSAWRLFIGATNGRVGVGTSNPQAPLQVGSGGTAALSGVALDLDNGSSPNGIQMVGFGDSTKIGLIQQNNEETDIKSGTSASASINFFLKGVQAMFIDPNSNVGIGTTTLTTRLGVQGDALVSGTTTAGNLVATSTLTVRGLAGSAGQCLTTNASGLVIGQACGSGSTFPFTPVPLFGTTAANATGTLIGFTNGLYALASSTIGNGTQFGGLTISGGATTTGNQAILGSAVIGTSTGELGSVNGNTGNLVLYNTNTAGASPALILGGNVGGDTDFWMGRQNDNNGANNDSLQIGAGLIPGTTPFMTWNYQGREGIGSTSPYAKLSVHANPNDIVANNTLFAIGSSTANSTTTLFVIANTGNVGIGSSTPNSLLSLLASTTFNYAYPVVQLATSTDPFGWLLSLFATSSTLGQINPAAGNTDSGVRALIGGMPVAGLFDQFNVNGRINTDGWANKVCNGPSGLITLPNADTSNFCSDFMLQFDGSGITAMNSTVGINNNFICLSNSGGATGCNAGAGGTGVAASGVGIFYGGVGGNLVVTGATSTPILDSVVKIDNVQNATSTNFYLGFTNINPGGTTFEVEPTSGCWFVASSTLANWQAQCRTSIANTTTVDTQIPSSTVLTGTGKFYQLRIEMGPAQANFYVASNSNQALQRVAVISTTYPASVGLVPSEYITRNLGAGSGYGFDFNSIKLWYQQNALQQ